MNAKKSRAPIEYSVIAPMLNEEASLPEFLSPWKVRYDQSPRFELLLSDSGSFDKTVQIAKRYADENHFCRVVKSKGSVLSTGQSLLQAWKMAQAQIVLVLPVDCLLSEEAWSRFITADLRGGWGGFRKKYKPSSLFLSIYGFCLNSIRGRVFRNLVWTNGIFFDRELLAEAKILNAGFLEDVLLSDHLKNRTKRFIWINSSLICSSRRYIEKGILRATLLNLYILSLFRLGIRSPGDLKKMYRKE